MTLKEKIPMIVAVSGHRDIHTDDITLIRKKVLKELIKIQNLASDQKKNIVPLTLLSGLAEGADHLVAEVALELGWDVIAVLPMPKQDYMIDFDTKSSRERFEELYQLCYKKIELPWHGFPLDQDIEKTRDQQYRNQGIFITRQAQLVIALWDGKPAVHEGACGTSYVVDLCRNGTPPVAGEILISPETTSVIHVPVRRTDQDKSPMHISHVSSDVIYKKVINEFLAFNSAIVNEDTLLKSRKYLFEKVDAIFDEGVNLLANCYSKADALSISNQKFRRLTIQIATIAIGLGVLSETIFNLSHNTNWLISYGVLFAVAYGLYYCLFRWSRVRLEDRYLEYRVLAEGLRVQIFWRIAGIKRNVAEHYLQLIKTEVGWVREGLRNIAFFAEFESSSHPDCELVKKVWVVGQETFFIGSEGHTFVGGKSRLNRLINKRFDLLSTIAFISGGAFVTLTGLDYVYTLDPQLKNIASACSGYFFLLAGLLKGYASVMGYAEQANRYEKCGKLFLYAKHAIENRGVNADLCFFELGKQALEENANWFMQHKRNAFQVKG